MVDIRDEQDVDQPRVFDVVRAAFRTDKEARLVNLTRERQHNRISLVAEADRLVIGYVLATPLSFRPTVPLNCLAIGPLAVFPDWQCKGVGSNLMEGVIQRARDEGVDALFLLGDPDYYPRFGFAATHIDNEYGATDAFMALELRPGCLHDVRALAIYVDEFSEVGA